MRRQVGGVLRSDSPMNTRIGIPTISGDKSCPTCLIKKERMRVEIVVGERQGVPEVRKMTTKFIECENCRGSGFVEEEYGAECEECEGSGEVEVEEEEEVKENED